MIKEPQIKIEKMDEPNMVSITVTVSNEDVEAELQRIYEKEKPKLKLVGYRDGKVPRAIYENNNGKNVFLKAAIENLVPNVMERTVNNCGLDIMAAGNPTVTQADSRQDLIFTFKAAVRPEVKLGQYRNLKYRKTEISVNEEEILSEIRSDLQNNSVKRRVSRPVKDGDEIRLDFKGYVDGVAFEGGEAKNYILVIGSHSFIPGFEEQLIGAEENKTIRIQVAFPENYHAENLKGKPAEFECTVSEICEKVVPELNEKFATKLGYGSVEEYKDEVRKALLERKTKQAKDELEDVLISQAVNNATAHIPDMIVMNQARMMMQDMARNIEAQGIPFAQYLEMVGQSEEGILNEIRPTALNQILGQLVLEEIAKTENIEATKEEIEKELKALADQYYMPVEQIEKTLGSVGMEGLHSQIRIRKVIELMAENAVAE